MEIISLNIGTPKHVFWKNKSYYTSIYKYPVEDYTEVRKEGIVGDAQANTKVHGGIEKAVYGYFAQHYEYWKDLLKRQDLVWGMFGENLTISGELEEQHIALGDIFQVGEVELMALQPRQPCSKLCLRFDDLTLVKKFWESDRPGIYFKVLKEGKIKAGDQFKRIKESSSGITILEAYQILRKELKQKEKIDNLLHFEEIPLSLKKGILEIVHKENS
jgi:MOSC domain-containing protein YiiM